MIRNKREEMTRATARTSLEVVMNRRLRLCSLMATIALLAACHSQQSSRLAAREWDTFVSGFIETYFEANPLFAVYQGRHEFDGRFPDWSDSGTSEVGSAAAPAAGTVRRRFRSTVRMLPVRWSGTI